MTAHRGHRARVDTDNRLVLERLTRSMSATFASRGMACR